MQLPLQITFRGFPHSDAVEANIREKANKLDQFYSRIMNCRVMVEARHRHHHQGNLYHVRIELTVPGKELVVSRERHDEQAHEDIYVAIRDAFDDAKRLLEDHARRQRGDVKAHEVPLHGTVVRLVPEQEHGFIETFDGREIYFHKNSVLGGAFDQLEIGSAVRFAEEPGEQGPQASTVHLVSKHHVAG